MGVTSAARGQDLERAAVTMQHVHNTRNRREVRMKNSSQEDVRNESTRVCSVRVLVNFAALNLTLVCTVDVVVAPVVSHMKLAR
jgi:hypothetical protein